MQPDHPKPRPPTRLPSSVYVRRRVTAIAVLVMVVAVGWLAFRALTTETASDPPGTAAGAGEDKGTESGAGAQDGSSPNAATPDPATVACTQADLDITLTPDPFDVASDATPKFVVTVDHVGTQPCLLTASADTTTLLIESGTDRVWFSGDCPAEKPLINKELVLGPGDQKQLSVAWPKIRSTDGCGAAGSAPASGYYQATLMLQGIPVAREQFRLI